MRNKYGARKFVTADGEKFDSTAEYRRAVDLDILQQIGEISGLKRQVPFVLAPSVKFYDENRSKPALKYIADFVYFEKDGNQVVEDVKGVQTTEFRIKRHLMLSVHGIQVKLIGARK